MNLLLYIVTSGAIYSASVIQRLESFIATVRRNQHAGPNSARGIVQFGRILMEGFPELQPPRRARKRAESLLCGRGTCAPQRSVLLPEFVTEPSIFKVTCATSSSRRSSKRDRTVGRHAIGHADMAGAGRAENCLKNIIVRRRGVRLYTSQAASCWRP
jgi:hypothetical protein